MKKVVFLDTNRAGYSLEQCGHTMTVGDLMDLLSEFDEESRVYFRNDGGYTYGCITYSEVTEENAPGEENEEEY